VQKTLILLVCLLVPGQVWAETAAMMVYKVWEQGVGVYFTRILVTDRHVRFDNGSDASDFTLFDRRKEAIYNVSVEDRSVLLIEQLPPCDLAGNVYGATRSLNHGFPI